jgi:hypothetical protein
MAQNRKLIGILTGAELDYGTQSVRTSPALGWSEIVVKLNGRGGWQTFDIIFLN